jgi:UDP-N-acetylglucosamine 2-epimerase
MKVVTVLGTRPEIIKLSRVIAELDKYVEHTLVHTGQNYDYELNEIFFDDLGIRKPDFFLEAVGNSTAETIGNVIIKIDEILKTIKPDAFLLLGDTNSCLSAISAKRLKIPIFHMEAGNRCFDLRVPEEINRKVVDHLSDINLTYTEHARNYLINEGISPETIFKTGSPMKEVLMFHNKKIQNSSVLNRLNLTKEKYFIISCHREENVDSEENFFNLLNSLNDISEKYNYPIIFSTHPRTRKRIESLKDFKLSPSIKLLKPLAFSDYVKLQIESFCVISDSGTITEESSILGFPAITIRQAHERPEGVDEGTLVMSGLNSVSVLRSINVVTHQFFKENSKTKIISDYDVDNVSLKVVRTILGYVDYVNRTVWKKQ